MIRQYCKNLEINLNINNYDVTFVSPMGFKFHGDSFYKYQLNL
ncbi:MAG TPA: hypothetical protein PLE28_02760 [bacterium]|nr:hypothetical protein [bacterium]